MVLYNIVILVFCKSSFFIICIFVYFVEYLILIWEFLREENIYMYVINLRYLSLEKVEEVIVIILFFCRIKLAKKYIIMRENY